MRGNWDESASVPPQQLDADTILTTLLAHEVEFVVIGGLAVGAHGYPRGTKDVDLVPSPARDNLRRLHAALSQLGAEPLEIGDFGAEELPVPFAPDDLDEGGNWALRTLAGRVDVLQWIPGLHGGYERLRANAIEDEVPGVGRIAFAGYDDLVAMKRTAGRPQHEADLHELEQVRRNLETCRAPQHEGASDASRARCRRRRHVPHARDPWQKACETAVFVR